MSAQETAKRPNILFFTDDQRFDTIRGLGNNEIITPSLDRLAATGTTFRNAYIMGGSCGAVCMPSRAMLMTGRTLFHLDRQGQQIPQDHVLLGEALRDAGYSTFGVGKWHNGAPSYARSFTGGAEIFFGGMADHWNVPACRFDPTAEYRARRKHVADFARQTVREDRCDHISTGKHSSELFCDAAIDFLSDYDSTSPFFLYVSFLAPHDPRTMPDEFRRMYDSGSIELPPSYLPEHPFDNGELRIRDERLAPSPRAPEVIKQHIADYYAMITHADAQIGRVLTALDESGHAGNTIVVFSGDNGLAVGRHGLMGKQNLYEHSVHVPLVFNGPGIPHGESRDALCYLLDLFPTLCQFTETAVPASVEGHSLLPCITDPGHSVRDSLLFAYTGVQRAAGDGRWKLIEYAVDNKRTTQLFDLAEDPWETNNLAGTPAANEHVNRLRAELRKWPSEMDDTGPLGTAFWQQWEGEAV